jgi:NAD(P)-dependent dehydrogenase (short-subunit alcohol dehydrogenase family)
MGGDPDPVVPVKVALVTGATSGIGAAVAEALASSPFTVVIVGRDQARSESTVARIRHVTGNNRVDYLLADLSSQDAVHRMCHEFLRRYSALHVLIANAGGLFLKRRESVDGLEMTLALNHLSPFLLIHLLSDVLRATGSARIVSVSSNGHHLSGGIRRDDLQWRRGIYRGFQAYHHSKLANLLFTYELARRLEGSGVTANAVHPGFVDTNIGRDSPWYWRMLRPAIARAFKVRTITAEESARGVVHLAVSPEVAHVTGRYFVDQLPAPSSVASQDVDTAQWLWAVSEELTGLKKRDACHEPGRSRRSASSSLRQA